ncbi:hypothetical protein C8R44DRAFT_890725 [Mycena epipterygia]|nr:hypothetical protein C8R44DRAFT_890725 [Mycena epipterygia]
MARANQATHLESWRSTDQPPFPPRHVRCPEPGCPWGYHRSNDLKRHSLAHMSSEEKAAAMFVCKEPNCKHMTLQKSNMETHYNAKYSGLKPHICNQCAYCAADPSSLHHHKRAVHRSGPPPQAAGCQRLSLSRRFDILLELHPFIVERLIQLLAIFPFLL